MIEKLGRERQTEGPDREPLMCVDDFCEGAGESIEKRLLSCAGFDAFDTLEASDGCSGQDALILEELAVAIDAGSIDEAYRDDIEACNREPDECQRPVVGEENDGIGKNRDEALTAFVSRPLKIDAT